MDTLLKALKKITREANRLAAELDIFSFLNSILGNYTIGKTSFSGLSVLILIVCGSLVVSYLYFLNKTVKKSGLIGFIGYILMTCIIFSAAFFGLVYLAEMDLIPTSDNAVFILFSFISLPLIILFSIVLLALLPKKQRTAKETYKFDPQKDTPWVSSQGSVNAVLVGYLTLIGACWGIGAIALDYFLLEVGANGDLSKWHFPALTIIATSLAIFAGLYSYSTKTRLIEKHIAKYKDSEVFYNENTIVDAPNGHQELYDVIKKYAINLGYDKLTLNIVSLDNNLHIAMERPVLFSTKRRRHLYLQVSDAFIVNLTNTEKENLIIQTLSYSQTSNNFKSDLIDSLCLIDLLDTFIDTASNASTEISQRQYLVVTKYANGSKEYRIVNGNLGVIGLMLSIPLLALIISLIAIFIVSILMKVGLVIGRKEYSAYWFNKITGRQYEDHANFIEDCKNTYQRYMSNA